MLKWLKTWFQNLKINSEWMSQIERLQERRIAAADQFLGRCLKVNELSNRPLDQVDQVDQPQS